MSNKIPYVAVLPELNASIRADYDPFISLLVSDSVFSFNHLQFQMEKDSTGMAYAEMVFDRFSSGSNSGFGAFLNFRSQPDKTLLEVRADSLRYGGVSLAGISVDLSVKSDSALYRVKAGNRQGQILYDIGGAATRSGSSISLVSTRPDWTINGYAWEVPPGEFLRIEPASNDFNANLHFRNDRSLLDLSGRKSGKLILECRNVILKTLLIPGIGTYGYDGEITGTLEYQGFNGTELDIQMDIHQLKVMESQFGDLRINGNFISDTAGMIESDAKIVLNDTSELNLKILYGKEPSRNNLKADFTGIPLKIFESFVQEFLGELQGEISGEIQLKPEGKNSNLNGEIRINKAGLLVVPLNAHFYMPDNKVEIDNNRLLFKQFSVIDSLDKRLTLNGSINVSDPSNITADLQATSDLLQVMNTTARDNPAFNGSIFVNSRISITGPVSKPAIGGSIVLAKGTVINYRYTEDLSVSETQKIITFAGLSENQADSLALKPPVITVSGSPDIEASVEIDPNSLFNFQISRGFDIGVSITGGGFLTYSVMPDREIDLSGTYEINQGSSELKIPGWPRKDFSITPGSSVKWDGKADDPELGIETTSKVRGSYVNPVDSRTREVNFLVYMKLSGRLSQLEILFDVRSEDQYLTSVFNSLSTDERMRQAINLLIFGSIQLPNLESSSDYVSQQINQFWESQLNQFTKSAIKRVDVSIGIDTYTGMSAGGAEETYTSLSYEVKKDMFRDRGSVMVSGQMNDNTPVSSHSNAVIENFIFEYALDTSRTKYLKVYRQQNYEDLLEGEVTKSGIGFIYRKSYDRISDIWRRRETDDDRK
jgi:hypothetical protein